MAAEILAIAGSAISIAAFAGQLAQGAAFLYTFFRDIQNAPADITRLADELRSISSILLAVKGSSITTHNPELDNALKLTEAAINDIATILTSLQQPGTKKKRQKAWNRFRVVLRSSDITNRLASLERCKSMMLQCCSTAIVATQTQQSGQLLDIHDFLGGLSTQQADHTTTVVQNTAAVDSLNQSVVRVEDSTAVVQTVLEELKSTSLAIEQRGGTMDSSISRVGRAASEAHMMVESIHSTSSALMTVTSETSKTLDHLVEMTIEGNKRREEIETTSRRLEEELLRRQLMLFEAFGHDIKRDIAEQLRNQRKKSEDSLRKSSDGRVHEETNLHSASKTSYSPDGNIYNNHLYKLENGILNLKGAHPDTEHIFRDIDHTDMDHLQCPGQLRQWVSQKEKETTVTTVRFLPASWLSSQAYIFNYKSLKFHGTDWRPPSPTWGLRNVNIIPHDSEFFEALQNLDLTPGRTSLGYLSVGASLTYAANRSPLTNSESEQKRLENLFSLVDLLTGSGVDPGEIDGDNFTPLMIFATVWSECCPTSAEQLNDKFFFLVSKLANKSQSDPFCSSEAIVLVDTTGLYRCCQFPGTRDQYPREMLSFAALDFFVRQETWKLSWTPHQPSAAVSLGCDWFPEESEESEDISELVSFWVTVHACEIRGYLEAKKKLLELLLRSDAMAADNGPAYLLSAIDELIHSGGQIIALLTEHSYGNSRERPWVRERLRKLVLVREYLTKIFSTILLIPIVQAELVRGPALENFTEHAQRHNARTLRAWRPQSQESVEDTELQEVMDDNYKVTADGWETDDSQSQIIQDPGDDDSDWETEEEWEEDTYMLDKAKDIYDEDAMNLQIRSPKCCEDCSDYDEDYWSHVYSQFKNENLDTASPERNTRGILRNIASATRDILAFIA
ncbi:hypothetical protein QBC37DRAFT_378605 [Rhypophila decipiens]|uniref:Fungal N-terminal domain-containing protein n=1 Tax=Rhypophila decipiens TaxID=261697 RepID=A0AAN6Y033_9PEZI|nr:hypothetical protein QBC37DRAFT_378605 [Rhypophila decipiens]